MRNYITLLCYFLAFSKGYADLEAGETYSSPDVVDGIDATPGQFPFQISMQIENKHFCGGSVLKKDYILTASHCTKDFNRTNQHLITVVAGTINVKEPQQSRHVEQIIQHEDYDPDDANRNDIALLKLDRPLEYNSKVKPVTLAEANTPIPTNSTVELSGWGSLGGEDNPKPTILQTTKIYVADQDYCVKVMKNIEIDGEHISRNVHPTNFCANNPNKRQGECRGDSGGPVTLNGKQVGIVSWSVKDPICASTKYPSVFTRVPDYIGWIKKHAV